MSDKFAMSEREKAQFEAEIGTWLQSPGAITTLGKQLRRLSTRDLEQIRDAATIALEDRPLEEWQGDGPPGDVLEGTQQSLC